MWKQCIAAHTAAAGSKVSREWLYRDPNEIREIPRDRAMRDPKTGRPVLYSSCDAHALRRFADDTWGAEWKMANGLRIWCVEGRAGDIIHLWGGIHVLCG